MKIKVLDPVDCQVLNSTGAERKWLRRLLSYKMVHYRAGQYSKVRSEYRHPLLVNMHSPGPPPFWCFPTGFLDRVQASANQDSMECEILQREGYLQPSAPLHLKDFEFRDDQKRLIESAISKQRGVLEAPTGSGKTILLMGLLAQYPDCRSLVVTHSADILIQTAIELKKVGIAKVGLLGAGHTPKPGNHVVVATRQAIMKSVTYEVEGRKYKKQVVRPQWEELVRGLDLIIIDEVHLFGDMDGQYAGLLRHTLAPMRLGLTATGPPEGEKVAMCLEGMVGPVIDRVTLQEGQDLGIVSKVKLELVPVKLVSAYKDIRSYPEMVQTCIVNNRSRNHAIMTKAKAFVQGGCTVLIFINLLDHGDRLVEVAGLVGLDVVFVEGLTKTEVRQKIKAKFSTGEVGCVISSKVWREGVNIPSLGAVIVAGGGKAELGTLQSVGRGLRRTATKDEAVVVDFLDPYKWLAEHTVQRLALYQKQGWL